MAPTSSWTDGARSRRWTVGDESVQSDRTEHKLDKVLSALAETNVRGATLTERLISIEHRVERTENDVRDAVTELKAANIAYGARIDKLERDILEQVARKNVLSQIGTLILTVPWLGAGVVYAVRAFLGLNISQ